MIELASIDLTLIAIMYIHCVDCVEGEVRLSGGTTYTEGRMEICLSGEWGTVCDQMWDVMDGTVVCRQLGFASRGKTIY